MSACFSPLPNIRPGKSGTAFAVLLTILLSFSLRAAAPPTLSALLLNDGITLRLELTGTTGTNYTIESSSDLKSWSHLAGGLAANGLFATQISLDTNTAKEFFRGRETGTPAATFPTNIVVGASTNLSVLTIVTTNGGSAVLFAPNGTRFTFTVPPLTLPGSQIITLTLVTNVGSLPFSGGMIAALRLDPDGLDLSGAASLEITLPPGLDRRKVISFSANADGTQFHLTPDRVTTNGVLIPVTQLSVYGSAIAALSELNAANVQASVEPTKEIASPVHASSVGADCFPANTDIALIVAKNIKVSMNAANQEMAVLIGQARQQQLLGVQEDSSDVLNKGEDLGCQLVKSQLQPYYADAQNNCALAKVLLAKLIGVERQRELMGITADASCGSSFTDFPLCPCIQNCLKEIDLCCLKGFVGNDKAAAILGLQRQEQLSGNACLNQSDIDKAITDCTSNAWTGNLTFTATGQSSTNETFPGFSRSTTKNFAVNFTAYVWESREFRVGDQTTVDLKMNGPIDWNDSSSVVTQTAGCGSYEREDDKTLAAGPSAFHVQLQTLGGKTYILLGLHVDDRTGLPGALGTSTTVYTDLKGAEGEHGCEYSGTSTTINNAEAVVLPPITLLNGTMSDSNTVTGSFTFPAFKDDPAADGKYNWQFKRHPAEQ